MLFSSPTIATRAQLEFNQQPSLPFRHSTPLSEHCLPSPQEPISATANCHSNDSHPHLLDVGFAANELLDQKVLSWSEMFGVTQVSNKLNEKASFASRKYFKRKLRLPILLNLSLKHKCCHYWLSLCSNLVWAHLYKMKLPETYCCASATDPN